jgi:hypothetical protein
VGLTDSSKETICELLKKSVSINFLSLEGNNLTASCAKDIVAILKDNSIIKELVLAANPLTNEIL